VTRLPALPPLAMMVPVERVSLDRREFWMSLFAVLSASAASAASPAQSTHDQLADVLGLKGDEARWLGDLTPAQQETLLRALRAGRPDQDTVALLYRVLGRRERLFAYVGYPPLPNRLVACDGLIRE
jgi:hypothetical protein